MHPQYDNIDHIRNENTIITVNLELIKGRLTTNRLYWQLQYGMADDTCSHLYPILDQRSLIPGNVSVACSKTQHRTCHLGDLTTKCG